MSNLSLQDLQGNPNLSESEKLFLQHADSYSDADIDTESKETNDFDFPVYKYDNPEEIRALSQSATSKITNGLVKALGTTAGSFAENMGTIISVPTQMIFNSLDSDPNTTVIQALYKNWLGEGVDSFNNYLKDKLPNYYSKAEQDLGAFEQMLPGSGGAANFWADKFLNGAGYWVGAMITPWGIEAGLSKAGIKNATKNLVKNGLDDIGKASLGQSLNSSKELSSMFKTAGVGTLMSWAESSVEARQIYNETLQKLKEDRASGENNYSESEINDIATSAANTGFLGNMLVTMPTNIIQFAKFIPGLEDLKLGNRANKFIQNGENLGETILKESSKYNFLKDFALGFIEEGGQEVAQLGIQKGSEKYYLSKYNPESNFNWSEALKESFNEAINSLGSKEGLESLFLGGILGGPGQIYQNYSSNKEELAKAEKLNSSFKDLKNSIQNLSGFTTYSKINEQALNSSDLEKYYDSKNDKFKSLVQTIEENGGTEILIEQLNQLKNKSNEDISTILNLPTTLSDLTVKSKVEDLIKNVKSYSEIHKQLQNKYSNFYNSENGKPVFNALFDAITGFQNINERVTKLSNELSQYSNGELIFDNNQSHDLNYIKEFKKQVNEVKKKFDNIDPSLSDVLLEKYKALKYLTQDKRVKYLEQYKKALNNPEEIIAEASEYKQESEKVQEQVKQETQSQNTTEASPEIKPKTSVVEGLSDFQEEEVKPTVEQPKVDLKPIAEKYGFKDSQHLLNGIKKHVFEGKKSIEEIASLPNIEELAKQARLKSESLNKDNPIEQVNSTESTSRDVDTKTEVEETDFGTAKSSKNFRTAGSEFLNQTVDGRIIKDYRLNPSQSSKNFFQWLRKFNITTKDNYRFMAITAKNHNKLYNTLVDEGYQNTEGVILVLTSKDENGEWKKLVKLGEGNNRDNYIFTHIYKSPKGSSEDASEFIAFRKAILESDKPLLVTIDSKNKGSVTRWAKDSKENRIKNPVLGTLSESPTFDDINLTVQIKPSEVIGNNFKTPSNTVGRVWAIKIDNDGRSKSLPVDLINRTLEPQEVNTAYSLIQSLMNPTKGQDTKGYLRALKSLIYLSANESDLKLRIGFVENNFNQLAVGDKVFTKDNLDENFIKEFLSKKYFIASNDFLVKEDPNQLFSTYELKNNKLESIEYPNYKTYLLSANNRLQAPFTTDVEVYNKDNAPLPEAINKTTAEFPKGLYLTLDSNLESLFTEKQAVQSVVETKEAESDTSTIIPPFEPDIPVSIDSILEEPSNKDSNLEAKKADIEKRRQEELKSQGLVTEKIETYEGNNDEGIKTQIQIRTQRNGEKAMYVQNEEGRWVRGADKLKGEVSNEKHLEGILYDGIKKVSEEKPESSVDKKINAKYDAELKALKQQDAEVSNQSKIEDKKADIERRRQEELGAKLSKDVYTKVINKETLDAGEKDFWQDTINKINAKYDAELAALEKPVNKKESIFSSEETVEKPVNLDELFGKVLAKKSNDTTKLNMTIKPGPKINLEAEADWFLENVGYHPTIIKGLIDNNALGQVMEYGKTLISDEAIEGTVYHEAFHNVSQFLLTDKELKAIYDEAREKFPKKSELEIEEILAEDFRNYKKTGKILNNRPKRNSLFRKILNYIKRFLGLKAETLQEVYERLDTGYYSGRKQVTNSSLLQSRKVKNLKSEVPGLTVKFTHDFIKSMDKFMGDLMLKGDRRNYSPSMIIDLASNANTMFDIIHDNIVDSIEELKSKANNDINNLSEVDKDSLNKLYLIYSNWDNLLKAYKEDLGAFGFEVEEDAPIDEELKIRGNDYSERTNNVNPKENINKNTKLLIRLLPEVEYVKENGIKKVKPVYNDLGFQNSVDFNKTYGYLLANVASIPVGDYQKFYDKVRLLSEINPNLISFLDRLKAPEDTKTKEDITLQNQLLQDINKHRTSAKLLAYDKHGDVFLVDANKVGLEDQIRESWQQNLKRKLQDKRLGGFPRLDPAVDRTGYIAELESFKSKVLPLADGSYEDKFKFLKAFGIELSQETKDVILEENPSLAILKIFNNTVRELQLALEPNKDGEYTNLKDILGPQSSAKNRIKELLELESAFNTKLVELSYLNAEKETEYSLEQYNTYSNMAATLNDESISTLEELFQRMPHFNTINNRNSLWLKTMFNSEGKRIPGIKVLVSYENGSKINGAKEGKLTRNLNEAEKIIQDFNNLLLDGVTSAIRAADASSEYTVNLNNYKSGTSRQHLPIPIGNFQHTAAPARLKEIYQGYFIDEYNRIFEAIKNGLGNNVKTYNKKSKDFTLFDEILTQDLKDNIFKSIEEGKQALEVYLDNKDAIDKGIEKFFEDEVEAMQQSLARLDIITDDMNTGVPDRLLKFDDGRTRYSIEELVRAFVVNDYINSVEQTKLFIGDLAFYSDFFKRSKALIGTKSMPRNDSLINNWFEEYYQANPRLDGKTTGFDKLSAAIVSDVIISSQYKNAYIQTIKEHFGEELAKETEKGFSVDEKGKGGTNEADAQGLFMPDDAYMFRFKLGKMSTAEDRQWEYEFAWTRFDRNKYTEQQLLNGQKEKDEQLVKDYESKIKSGEIEEYPLQVIKAQYFGQSFNNSDLYTPTFHKYSLMPLTWRLVKGTNMEEQYLRMEKQKIGYLIFDSASKVGTLYNKEGKQDSFYDSEGNISKEEFTPQIISYDFLGEQVKVSPPKDKVTFGTQMRKLIWSHLFNAGQAINSKFEEFLNRFTELNNELSEKAKEELLKELGVKKSIVKNKIKLPKKKLTPTNEQKSAIEKIVDFIEKGNPNEYFVLQGKAGTGKTTIINEVLNNFTNKKVVVGALSHKAKNVIKKSIENKNNKIEFNSLAGILGLKLDLETGEFTESKESKEPSMSKADIIIIDEASMINEEAVDLLMSNKNKNAKVLFLGDIGQLPPIRSLKNPYYQNKENQKFINKKSPVFENKNKVFLTERIRQGESSPILPFADYFWENSQNKENRKIEVPRENIISDKGSLIFVNSSKEIINQAVELFKQSVKDKNPNLIKFVTYKNDTRKAINDYIHEALFGKNSTIFNSGELILFNDSYNNIENASEAQIERILSEYTNEQGFKVFTIEINLNDGKNVIEVLDFEDREAHNKYISQLFQNAFLKKGSYDYIPSLEQAWAEKRKYANIDYSYAITSHKSQGSTYDTVIVHEQDIQSVNAIDNKTKSESIYTALTRAKNIAVVISNEKVKNLDDTFNLKDLNESYISKSEFENYQEIESKLYTQENVTKLVNMLRAEAIDRKLANNIVKAFDTEEVIVDGKKVTRLKYYIDTMVNRDKVNNMLTAIVSNRLIKMKTNGDAMVQAASTGWETIGKRDITTSNFLKFYRKSKEGATLPAEVMQSVGKNYKPLLEKYGTLDKLNSKIEQAINLREKSLEDLQANEELNDLYKAITIVGYRIPTQGTNSIEYMIIRKFLPGASNTIILPSEITTKSGGDYDIDKLQVFRKKIAFDELNLGKIVTLNKSNTDKFKADIIEQLKGFKVEAEAESDLIEDIFGVDLPETAKSLKKDLKDVDKYAIQNEMIELYEDVLKSEENFANLIIPNSTSIFSDMLPQVQKAAKISTAKVPESKIISYKNKIKKFFEFMTGKPGVGIAATNNTFHVLAQAYGLKMNYKFNTLEKNKEGEYIYKNILVSLPHNLNIGESKTVDGQFDKSEIFSQTINITVDIAKNPELMFDLNITQDTLGVFMFLTHVGVNPKVAIAFLNQPIIKEYLELNTINDNMALRATNRNTKSSYNSSNLLNEYFNRLPQEEKESQKQVTYQGKPEDIVKKLLGYIENKDGSVEYIKSQISFLEDFLNYKDYANLLRESQQAVNFDTAGLGKDLFQSIFKLDDINKVLKTEFIPNLNNVIDNSFISHFNQHQFALDLYSPLYYIHKDKELESAIKEFAKEINRKPIESVGDIVNDYINFVSQQYGVIGNKFLGDFANELMTGENSLPKLIHKLKTTPTSELSKTDRKLKKNAFIQEIYPQFENKDIESGDVRDNLKFFSKKLDKVSQDRLTEAFREIKDISPTLYNQLVYLGMLQSGLRNSPITFYGIIPQESAGMIIKEAFQNQEKYGDIVKDFQQFHKDFIDNNARYDFSMKKLKITSSDKKGNGMHFRDYRRKNC